MIIEHNSLKLIADFAKAVLDEPSPSQLLSLVVLQVLAPLECRGAILGVVRQEGFLDLVGSYGYKDETTAAFTRMPLWTPLPITDAARTGEVNVFDSRQKMIDKYPHLAQVEESDGCTVSIPLMHRNTVLGAIGFSSQVAPSQDFESQPLTKVFASLSSIYVRSLLDKNHHTEPDLGALGPALSPRQKQIIELFDEDLTTEQMADRLRYSPSTIKQDIIKIYSIFGVNTRSAVIELAKRAGLVDTK